MSTRLSFFLGLIGILLFIVFWSILSYLFEGLARFSPFETIEATFKLFQNSRFYEGMSQTLMRLFVGLFIAILLGVPIGIVIGRIKVFDSLSYIPIQLLRMTSPLSWTPIAIILFGIGSGPVYFLIAIAAIWPIILNTAAGIKSVNSNWLLLGGIYKASNYAIVKNILFRAALPSILTGIQLALGVAWIVLVPAEMLGVASGLGYMILDFRDVSDYGSVMAIIIVIGILGLLTDLPLRYAIKKFSWIN